MSWLEAEILNFTQLWEQSHLSHIIAIYENEEFEEALFILSQEST